MMTFSITETIKMKKTLLSINALLVVIIVLSIPGLALSQGILSQNVKALADKLVYGAEGTVLSVEEDVVYINLGQNHEITTGNRFEIIRQQKPLTSKGEIPGYTELKVAEVEVERVRKNISIARVTDKTGDIAKGDLAFRKIKKITRLIVAEFSCKNGKDAFAKNVQNLLLADFVQKGMQVVETEKLNLAMRNNGLVLSDLKNPDTACKLGKLLGADVVVLGSIFELMDSVNINARFLDIKQNIIIADAGVEIDRTFETEKTLSGPVLDTTGKKKGVKAIQPEKMPSLFETMKMLFAKPERKEKYFETKDLCLTVRAFSKSGHDISMTLVYDNLGDSNIAVRIKNIDNIYLIDENNNKWIFKGDSAGVSRWGKSIIRNAQFSTNVSFTAVGSYAGTVFKLFMPHSNPHNFQVVINDLIPYEM